MVKHFQQMDKQVQMLIKSLTFVLQLEFCSASYFLMTLIT